MTVFKGAFLRVHLVQPRSNSSGGKIWIYPKIIIIIIQYLDRFAWNPHENSMNIP